MLQLASIKQFVLLVVVVVVVVAFTQRTALDSDNKSQPEHEMNHNETKLDFTFGICPIVE